MKYKKYDIMLVHFPFSHLRKVKKRPAIVIKDLEGDNTILCQVSTKERKIKKYSVELKKEDCDWDIRFNSYIYLDMIQKKSKPLPLGRIKGHFTII